MRRPELLDAAEALHVGQIKHRNFTARQRDVTVYGIADQHGSRPTTVARFSHQIHVTTAFAILRHNGVDVGKLDYIGAIPVQEG